MSDARGNRSQTDSSSGWKIPRFVLSSFVIASLAVVVDRFLVTPVFLRPIYVQRAVDSAVEYKDGALDEHVVSMFVTYDENLDGTIDLSEFVKVANRILNRKGTESATEEIVDGVPDWDSSGEQITLLSFFTPLVLTSMTKYSEAHFTGSELPLQGLKSWKNVATPMATFPVNAFGAFVPLQFWTVSLGEPWYIVEPRINKLGPNLSNDRYYPPPVKGRLAILFRLLAMFHPRPFLLTRFGPQGTVGCVRAENQDYWDIVFRIHAEFQLNEPPLLPFWFTPGQFLGNIVVKKDGQHIESFHMAVPTNRSLNVDMEWLVTDEQQRIDSGGNDEEGPPDMEVDIGYLPEMKLGSTAPSDVLIETEENKDSSKVKEIKWDKEISFEEAYRALEVKLYDFKEVPYLPFRDAIDKARAENKLVHHILLWGALDDQSC